MSPFVPVALPTFEPFGKEQKASSRLVGSTVEKMLEKLWEKEKNATRC